MSDNQQIVNRWRLILGDFAEDNLPLNPEDRELDGALYFLYNREYGSEHGMRDQNPNKGGREGSMLTVPGWLRRVKRLFPKKTVEVMQKQALDKYNLTQLLTDESVLRQLEPNMSLLKNILSFRDMMPNNVKKLAYSIVEEVIKELQKRLEVQVKRTFYGRKLPMSNSPYKIFRNFDFKQTIKKNLKNYSHEYGTIIPERLYFNLNVRRYNPWHVVILVDESGSMMDSVIYTAVMASIFAKMPFLSVKLVIFDTSVVDLSDHIDDPVATLMKVQLGGGTDIHKALEYGKKIITAPQKTIVVLVSDLYDGNNYNYMYGSCKDIIEAGSRLFVLPALDYSSTPCYDKRAAKTIAGMGAEVAAITPEELAEWIGKIIL
ncbi:VWA domain-containing protein [Bacteroides sp. 519]|uniref:VWA domain-containing protein n=1 Tax=Bacteroides sp. 519 TaxID=2302937 RepID=UPI0013D520CE|nr:VWA domain-containing protein [Bacteroides sp. 519]NDV57120.1 VWA domain-containing protein [Bacteroides sp. 519]